MTLYQTDMHEGCFPLGEKETKFMHILNHKIQRRRDYSIIYRQFQFRQEQAPKSSILDHDIIENQITSFQRNMDSWVVSPVWSLYTHASRPGPVNTKSKGKKTPGKLGGVRAAL